MAAVEAMKVQKQLFPFFWGGGGAYIEKKKRSTLAKTGSWKAITVVGGCVHP